MEQTVDLIVAKITDFISTIILESKLSYQHIADLTDLSKNEIVQLRDRQKDFKISTFGKLCAALERHPLETFVGSLQNHLTDGELLMLELYRNLNEQEKQFAEESVKNYLKVFKGVLA